MKLCRKTTTKSTRKSEDCQSKGDDEGVGVCKGEGGAGGEDRRREEWKNIRLVNK